MSQPGATQMERHGSSGRQRSGAPRAKDAACLRQLAEHVGVVVYRYVVRPRRVLSYISPAVTPLIGYTPEDFYAEPRLACHLVVPEDRPALVALARGRHGCVCRLVRYRRRDGSVLWVQQCSAVVARDARGPTLVAGMVRDLTWEHATRRLLAGIGELLARSGGAETGTAAAQRRRGGATGRLAQLTRREREVFEGLVAGAANKHIAAGLGISVKTVETYRARLMDKLGAPSVVALVRLALGQRTMPAASGAEQSAPSR